MAHRSWLADVVAGSIVSVVACTGSAVVRSSEPTGQSSAVGAADTGAATRYRVGDFVVYEYSGSQSPRPVVLRERIVEQRGNVLHIEVEARRGEQVRRWVQVVTDTPENQKQNKVDALWELRDGQRVERDPADQKELYRLYEWTLPPHFEDYSPKGITRKWVSIAGRRTDCAVQSAKVVVKGQEATLELATCEAFVWTNGEGRLTRSDGTVLWQVQVRESGRL